MRRMPLIGFARSSVVLAGALLLVLGASAAQAGGRSAGSSIEADGAPGRAAAAADAALQARRQAGAPSASGVPFASPAPAPIVAPSHIWEADRGLRLDRVLGQWAERAGWQLVWQSDHYFTLEAASRFEGDFTKASGDLLEAFSRAQPPLYGEFYQRNRVLVVTTGRQRTAD